MKQALSIFLLFVAVFNLGGYGLFMAHLEDRANEKMELALDNDKYDASQLISIKIPITNLPYYTNSAQYLREDGLIEIKGVVYNYVMQRIYNDSLEVLCIPNNEATKLLAAKDDFFKLNGDIRHAGQGKKPVSAGRVLKFYSPGNCGEKRPFNLVGIYTSGSKKSNRAYLILPFYYVSVMEDPPDA